MLTSTFVEVLYALVGLLNYLAEVHDILVVDLITLIKADNTLVELIIFLVEKVLVFVIVLIIFVVS